MEHDPEHEKKMGRKGWIWMAACCVPMIAIVILIALGFWGSR
jgi:hypothetical protein